mgnify:CR=1 FL=1
MVMLGIAHSVLDSDTIQVKDVFSGGLFLVKCNAINALEIKEKLEDTSDDILIEFDDDTMEMID